MAYSPKQKLVYIPEMQHGATYIKSEMPNLRENFLNLSIITTYDQIDPNDGKGSIVAMDPVTLKPKWKVQHDSFWNGGILATEGILFFKELLMENLPPIVQLMARNYGSLMFKEV